MSTLYFEADQGDGFREPGFSKERRLEPQITIGLLTGQGSSLMVSAFEGNRAETKTMLPVIGSATRDTSHSQNVAQVRYTLPGVSVLLYGHATQPLPAVSDHDRAGPTGITAG